MTDPNPNAPAPTPAEEKALLAEVIRVNRTVLGLTLGILFGFGLFLATNILVLKGGENVGANLQLLGQFFPGYRVTFLGSLLGLVYGFMAGYVSGWIIASIYNGVVLLRNR